MDESSLFPGFGRPDDHDRTDERTRGTRRKRQPGEAKACAEEAAKHAAAPLGCEAPATDAGKDSVAPEITAAIEVAAAPPCPDDCVASAPFVPVTLLDHTHLAAHTFDHLEECPFLGITATGYVEECLRLRRRRLVGFSSRPVRLRPNPNLRPSPKPQQRGPEQPSRQSPKGPAPSRPATRCR